MSSAKNQQQMILIILKRGVHTSRIKYFRY